MQLSRVTFGAPRSRRTQAVDGASRAAARAIAGRSYVCLRTERAAVARNTRAMDWIAAAREWKYFRNEVRGRWRRLTDAQLQAIAGHRGTLEAHIRASYELTPEQAERQIRDFEARNEFLRATSSR